MSKKKATVAKATPKVEEKVIAPKEEAHDTKAPKVNDEPTEETQEAVEAPNEVIEDTTDGKVWTKDWRELVKVDGSKDDRFGRQYYGVKR